MSQKGKVTSYLRNPPKCCLIEFKTNIVLFQCKDSRVEAQYSGEIFGRHLEFLNQGKAEERKKILPRGWAIGGSVNDRQDIRATLRYLIRRLHCRLTVK